MHGFDRVHRGSAVSLSFGANETVVGVIILPWYRQLCQESDGEERSFRRGDRHVWGRDHADGLGRGRDLRGRRRRGAMNRSDLFRLLLP